MLYSFDEFELDAGKIELRRDRALVPLEPQVFSLLLLLVENSERMVSREEIIEKIWDGRFVSDSAITSRIKFARQALGDSGKAQRYIRTIHGQGFRFVANVKTAVSGNKSVRASSDADDPQILQSDRPSIAVLPFKLIGLAGQYSAIADAVPHDIIAALARLRWLFVIARGSSFRFRSIDDDIGKIGSALNARYCLSGTVEVFGRSIAITVELADTGTGGVLWGDRIAGQIDDVHVIRDQIITNIISALELHIPLNEAQLARLTSPENLDAWSAYHLGLVHMFRFNRKDNASATAMFENAITKEPGFARAYAGLSFTHFQNSFMGYSTDIAGETDKARRYAERGIELDPVDPFANFTMGRSFWLNGDLESSLTWLDRATALSPNFAQGYYARAWADTVSERGEDGRGNVEAAMSLSPIDPLIYAMRATRALSCLVEDEVAEAATWADEAARTPGAHVFISLIAVVAHTINDDDSKAAFWAADARRRRDDVSQERFFRSFPFRTGNLRNKISAALTKHGF